MELEEKILNGAVILGLVCLFFPWFSGEWLGGDTISYSAFGFYISFLGIAVAGMLLFTLLILLVPLLGGPVLIRRRNRDLVRLILTALSSILTLSALSVLTKVTFEFSRMEIRYGIYGTMVGCIVATLYAFLSWQEFRKSQVQELFHHPEDHAAPEEDHRPPPPPPPPAPEPEEHRLVR